MVDFDQSRDDSMYDENLKDVYRKYYVKLQYIFKDDTIKSLRDKICCGIKSNNKFDNELFLVPSRQYFWSEYDFENKPDQVMLGQKWIRRNELLRVDIKPNDNLKVYEKLRNNLSRQQNIRKNIRNSKLNFHFFINL